MTSPTTHGDACTCREHPLPAAMSVRGGLRTYLAENGFTVEGYNAPRTEAAVFGVRMSVPNTPRHRWAIMLHDLHHVATGYGTDMGGEAEISVWEGRRGLQDLGAYVAGIVVTGAFSGLFVAPRRTFRAWSAPGAARSLFITGIDYDALLRMTVGELRDHLGIPREGLGNARRLHAYAPNGAVPRPA